MPVRTLRTAVTCALVLAVAALVRADTVRHEIAPGVVFTQETVPPPEGPLVWNVLRVDPKAPGVRVQAALGRDVMLTDEAAKGREAIADLANRRGAIAAVNADFFPYTGRPLGLTIIDGEFVAEGLPYRAVIGLASDGQVRFDRLMALGSLRSPAGDILPVDGVNRLPDKDQVTLLLPVFGSRTRAAANAATVELVGVADVVRPGTPLDLAVSHIGAGDPNAPIGQGSAVLVGDGAGAVWLRGHLRPGDRVSLRIDLASVPDASAQRRGELASRAASLRARGERSVWSDVVQAVGGGPWLVRDGKVAVDGADEGFSEKGFVQARHPRTAFGVTASGELLLVTVDGRQAFSKGASLPDMARHMIGLGAVQAINLDGGGSTSMVVRGLYVNGPSDGAPRPVADALLVFAPSTVATEKREASALALQAGGQARIDSPASDTLFGTIEGRAFVDQRGVLTSSRASSGTVVALAGASQLRVPYRVQTGPPARLTARLEKAPNDPPDRSMLVATVADAYGNGVAGQTVRIEAVGGTPERSEAVTDTDGRVTVEVVWDVEEGRAANVRSGTLKPATVRPK